MRKSRDIEADEAREMWVEAENSEDVKVSCCDCRIGDKLPGLLGDEPWYAKWPSVPNHKYQYLDRIVNAVRVGLSEMEHSS